MIAAMIARLQAINPQPFKAIEGAAALADLDKNLPPRTRLPLACVYPMLQGAEDNQVSTGVVQQRVPSRFGVAIFQAAQAQRQGESAVLEMEPLYLALRKQLVGWLPADTADEIFLAPMLFGGGSMRGMEGGLAVWLDEFTIDQLIRR